MVFSILIIFFYYNLKLYLIDHLKKLNKNKKVFDDEVFFIQKKNLLFTAIACHVRCEMWPRTGHLRVTKLGFAQLQEEMLGSSQEYSLIFTGFKFLSRPKLSNHKYIFLFHAAYFDIKMTTQLKKKYFPYFKNMY